MISINVATSSDRDDVVRFIQDEWNPNHIFVRNADFFDYEMNSLGYPQFLLAKDGDTIVGSIGFIQYGQVLSEADLYLVLFTSKRDYARAGVGIQLLKACKDLTCGGVHTVGANPKALPLYSLLGFETGFLSHYYWLNPGLKDYRLAVSNGVACEHDRPCDRRRTIIETAPTPETYSDLLTRTSSQKSHWYFEKRYFCHPIYQYQVHAIDGNKGDEIAGFGVTRVVEHAGAKALRIVDWIGEDDAFVTFCRFIQADCMGMDAEYVDLYCTGIPDGTTNQANMSRVDKEVIIPNYFSPFVRQNVEISYATTNLKNTRFFRGDGDQDRPS